MDVILHVGAHRTGCGSLQDYMHRHAAAFDGQGIAFWAPRPSKSGDGPPRGVEFETQSSIEARLTDLQAAGIDRLIVSDADLIGTVAQNMDQGSLYPDAGARLARIAALFDGRVRSVVFSPRSLELYWCSALACAAAQGSDLPSRDRLRAIAMSQRGWRDVIGDLADVMPQALINVLPAERFTGRPEALLKQGAGIDAPLDQARVWLNRVPTLPDLRRALRERGADATALPFGMGRWNPFTAEECAALREMQADDMMWLTAGAGGLAKLIEDDCGDRAGHTPPDAAHRKGHNHECEERDMAYPRRG